MVERNTKSKLLRACGYIRVSSEDQVEGYSLAYQTEAIQSYCRDRYKLDRIYEEPGVSGKTVHKRDAFQQMYHDCLDGRYDVVLVWKLDRFTRDIETGVASFFHLKNHGILIVSVSDGLTSESDDLMTLLSIGIADKYRKDLIVNVKRGMRTKLKGGDPRIGLAGQPIARYWDDGAKMFRLKEDEAAEWREAAKTYAAGIPAKDIAEDFKKRGSKTIPTTAVNVRRKLRKGLGSKHTIHFDGEVFEFPCEPIVDEKTERAVIALMDKRRHAPNIKPEKFLLGGYLFCAGCGKKLTSWNGYKKKERRYVHQDRQGCEAVKTVRADYINKAVLKECFLVFGDKKSFEAAIQHHLPDAKAREEIESDTSRLRRQLAKHRKNQETILDKVLNADLTPSIIDGLNRRAEQVEKNIEQTQDELTEKERRLASMGSVEDYKAAADQIHSDWKTVYSGWDAMQDMPYRNRKHLIDLMFDGVDENGRPYGVYIQDVGGKGKVFDYEVYGRFTEGSRFMKGDDSDYFGKEMEGIEAGWDRDFQAQKRAHRANRKSCCLKMGGTGLEPVASCL